DEKELAKARKTLSNALLGFLLVVSSYFIVGFMGKRLGFSTLFTPSIQGTGAGGYYCLNIQVVGTATQPTDILLRGETSSGATYDLFVTQVRADTIISGVTFEASNTVYSSYILAYDGPAVHVVKTLGHSDLQLNNCVDVSN
ncbi:hypothetical protein KJ664_00120, partial [Patescibacteria group bacterium]|nr:hypothetical protein [Patescibacteria group bacterium]